MMSRAQRVLMMAELWPNACRAQGWDKKDADLRHSFYAEVLGAEKRFSEFTNDDFDAVKAACLALASNVQGAMELDHPESGRRRRLLWVIENEQMPLLRLYGKEPESYIASVIRDKFQAASGLASWRTLRADRAHPEVLSELEQLRMVLTRAIDRLRKASGDTKAMMKARLEQSKSPDEMTAPDEAELATAGDGDPF